MIPCGNPHPHSEHVYTRWTVRQQGDSKAAQAFCDGGQEDRAERLADEARDVLEDRGIGDYYDRMAAAGKDAGD